jgi:hypothetical protein
MYLLATACTAPPDSWTDTVEWLGFLAAIVLIVLIVRRFR